VLEFPAETIAHPKDVVRSDRCVAEIRKPVEIPPQQQSVVELVQAAHGVGPDVRGLEDRSSMFVRDGARTTLGTRRSAPKSCQPRRSGDRDNDGGAGLLSHAAVPMSR
jgi:hypothetical protein